MSCITYHNNHARQLLSLIVVAAMLTSVFAVASYSGTRSRVAASPTTAASSDRLASGSGSNVSPSGQVSPQSLNRWSSTGPDAEFVLPTISSLAIDPGNSSTVYARTDAGMYKSTNSGGSWTLSAFYPLAFDPHNPNTIYAIDADHVGLSKSTDGGATWNEINNGLKDQYGHVHIATLVIDSANPNVIYVATGAPWESGRDGVFKSTDGGGTWSQTRIWFSITFARIDTLAIDPVNANTIYAGGSAGFGLAFKSTDNGATWSPSFTGLSKAGSVTQLAIDPTNPNIIYAASPGGVFKSTNGSQSWNAFNDGLSDLNINALAIDPVNPTSIYAATLGGVFKSSNGGSWTAANSGLTNLSVQALVIDPVNTAIIYAGTQSGGIFKSTNGGATWSASNNGLYHRRGFYVNSLAVDPGNANTIYAGAYGDGLFKSVDNGGSWRRLENGLTAIDISALAIDPFNTATVYVGTYGSGVYKTTNGGESWSLSSTGLESPNVYTLAIDPRDSDVIYAGGGGGVFKSTNGGGSWSAIGDPNNPLSPVSLVIDPSNSNTIYAVSNFDSPFGSSSVASKSIDAGVSWGGFFVYGSVLAIDPINTGTIYVASGLMASGYIIKSTDGGGSWGAASTGLPDSVVSSLVVDPVHPNIIYAGTYGGGVFKSADGGASWNPLNDGLANPIINSLAIDASGNFLHAGTTAGVFDIQFSATTPEPNTVQFSSSSYTVSEGSPRVDITLNRSGATTRSAAVSFVTSDGAGLNNCDLVNGVASPRCDYINTSGAVQFAAGETSKSFSVAIVDDAYAEGNETFTVSLAGAADATLGTQSAATVTIIDNDSTNGANPIDSTEFFVRQQYIDFLGREPDPPGFAGWTSTINNCTGDTTQCDRTHVSQLFFQSEEFQSRGYFVYRFYPVAFGRKPDYAEFVPDLSRVSGFLTDSQLEAAKVRFIADFMARPAFANTYNGLNDLQYVAMLTDAAGVTLPNRGSLIDGLTLGRLTRAQVLRQIVESSEVSTKYNHQAFAVMEYFGYLRRQPDAFYLNWIQVLDSTNDPRGMVNGFVNSSEYRRRFGP